MSDTVQGWEIVSEGTEHCPRQVARLAVPGGWLYTVAGKISMTTTFVPWPAAEVNEGRVPNHALEAEARRASIEAYQATRNACPTGHQTLSEVYQFQALQQLVQQVQLDGQAQGLGQSELAQNTLANRLWTQP